MSVLTEVKDLNAGSVRFARGIGRASSGEELGAVLTSTKAAQPGAYIRVQQAVAARLRELGGVGNTLPLFMLAADLAVTEEVARASLQPGQRTQLRRLWNELRAQ